LVQLLQQPTRPEQAVSPNKPVAIIGAILASILTIVALMMLWKRKMLLEQIKRAL
jgi:uncharacterized protein involved in exopolysaccharide biosynthesis